jgi:hypothetical protein
MSNQQPAGNVLYYGDNIAIAASSPGELYVTLRDSAATQARATADATPQPAFVCRIGWIVNDGCKTQGLHHF